MRLAPVARRVKIRITSGGSSHSDLDSLLRRFSVADLAPLVADGRLGRWLVQIGEPAKSTDLESLAGNRFVDADSIITLLHVFFDFEKLSDLAREWTEKKLTHNLQSLRNPALLTHDVELAILLAEKDFSGQEIADPDLWLHVFQSIMPEDPETSLRLVPFMTKLGLSGRAKSVMKKFSQDDKVKEAFARAYDETVLKELKFWLTNIRLIREYRPKIQLDSEIASDYFNTALYNISKANRNYYSKEKEEKGLRYRPQMIVGRDAIMEMITNHVAELSMIVLRLIASLCKMQFFDKQGALNIGTVPGLDLLSNRRIEYSPTVNSKFKEIKTIQDFAEAPFSTQIVYIVSETLLKKYEYYFGNEE